MNKGKVGILIDDISHGGGTERVASLLSHGLEHNFSDIYIFSLKPGLPFFSFPKSIIFWEGKYKNRILRLLEIAFFLKKNKFKAILIISMGKLSFQSVPILKTVSRKTKIISCDHVSIESFNKFVSFIKSFSYRLADEICVLTEEDKKILKNKFRITKNVNVIRNISPYENVNIEDTFFKGKGKVVLAVGRLAYQKNFSRLLDIWKAVKPSGWNLYIAGDGEDRIALTDFIKNNKLESSVNLLGNVDDVSYLYTKASVLCMTSRYEGLPMVLIECKNFGIPAIAFDCKTGPKELIYNDGFLIPYDDDSMFIEKLNALISDDELRNHLGKNAIINSSLYTSEKIIPQWVSLINK